MITRPHGFFAQGTSVGIKPSGSPDLALIASDRPAAAAGVFTTNRFPGAPVIIGKRHVRGGKAQAIVCNSGVSNVGTGRRGLDDARAMCGAAAEAINHAGLDVNRNTLTASRVLPASTGVIGQPLPIDKITAGIADLAGRLDRGGDADTAAAAAILTTDPRPKQAARTVELSTGVATLGGIAKGAGMIAPHMATMLAFITTDAEVDPRVLRRLTKAAAARTFNRVSIDGDTSTSDMVLVLANAASRAACDSDAEVGAFAEALDALCGDLAEQLVRDGEGVTRLMEVTVTGAATVNDADRVGRAVVNSPLVKTALHGGDPNWGRLVMAVGKSGAKLRPASLTIRVGGITVLHGGEPTARTADDQRGLEAAMQREKVPMTLDLGLGEASATWLGCDLSRDYVGINADYTT